MICVLTTRDTTGKLLAATVAPDYDPKAENRNDWKTFEAAQEIAAMLGPRYVATDAGPHCSPRYDVIRVPKLGAAVSYAMNGDSYPCGFITKVSPFPHRRVQASDANGNTRVFYRRRQTGSWVHGGCWSLQPGHVHKRNPEF